MKDRSDVTVESQNDIWKPYIKIESWMGFSCHIFQWSDIFVVNFVHNHLRFKPIIFFFIIVLCWSWYKALNPVPTSLTSDGLSHWTGVGCSSEVERLLMVRWVVGSILHGVDPLSYFLFQPVLHDWCNKGCGMCYPVCGMVHIKEPLLLIGKSSLCGSSGFPFSLSEWSLTIYLTPYNRR